ncbi:ABC transporter substrate-binding protein [Rhizobium sp. RU20A]|uniref:ABC transporter substrate-binding protein n=1 Tax=Rhizobium sp. RU20A TaxID=1907412 RepID=UPI00122C9DB6|nr:ABC transporter substrate-binding protein [Rhizobium sp. RU20A]
MRVAVVAPQSGPFQILGDQIRAGATFAAKQKDVEIVEIDERCETTGEATGDGDTLAKSLAASGAQAAVGFLCTEGLEASLPVLAEAGIPAISVSVRSDVLMADALKKGWPFFRLVPGQGDEAMAVAGYVARNWKDVPFALLDDGTIQSRELTEAVRTILAEKGMSAVFTDTFRPAQEQQVGLVRRLAKSGATHVFTSGDRNDTAILARDAASEKIALTIAGGDQLNGADQTVPLANGVKAITVPDYAGLAAASDLVKGMQAEGMVAEGYVLPAAAAVTIAADALTTAEDSGISLADAIAKGSFSTAIGTVSFTAARDLAPSPYRPMVWQDGRFVPAP